MVTKENKSQTLVEGARFETPESILTMSRKFAILEFVYICAKVKVKAASLSENPI